MAMIKEEEMTTVLFQAVLRFSILTFDTAQFDPIESEESANSARRSMDFSAEEESRKLTDHVNSSAEVTHLNSGG
jgi:hypothetical protein